MAAELIVWSTPAQGADAGTHRALTPLLPAFVAASEARRDWSARLLAAAQAADEGERFVVDGVTFARCRPHPRSRYAQLRASELWADVLHVESGARAVPLHGGRANITRLEEDAFWAWAIVETLRHTGIRIEELLEVYAKCLVWAGHHRTQQDRPPTRFSR